MPIAAGSQLRLTTENRPLPGAMSVALAAPGPVSIDTDGSVPGGSVALEPCTNPTKRLAYWGYAIKAAILNAAVTLANGAIVEGFTGVTPASPVYVADDGSLTHTAPEVSSTVQIPVESDQGTVSATTSFNIIVPPGVTSLAELSIVVKTAITANDTNYWTFTAVNKGNSDAAMLAATDANTTKATGGSGITAYTERELTLHGTGANLQVEEGDVIEITATKASSAANLVQFTVQAMFEGGQVGQIQPVGLGVRSTAIYFFAR